MRNRLIFDFIICILKRIVNITLSLDNFNHISTFDLSNVSEYFIMHTQRRMVWLESTCNSTNLNLNFLYYFYKSGCWAIDRFNFIPLWSMTEEIFPVWGAEISLTMLLFPPSNLSILAVTWELNGSSRGQKASYCKKSPHL